MIRRKASRPYFAYRYFLKLQKRPDFVKTIESVVFFTFSGLLLALSGILTIRFNMNKKAIFAVAAICFFSLQGFSRQITDTVKVLGNCESCKARIEKAAKQAGASKADWSDKTEILTVSYDDASTSLLAIEKQIAFAGHDTRDVKATTDAYAKLNSCCQYDRTGTTGRKACDKDEKEAKQ